MTPTDSVPPSVEAAQIAINASQKHSTRMIGGIMGMILIAIGANFLQLPELVAQVSVFGMVGWGLGYSLYIARQSAGWRTAQKVVDEWQRQLLRAEAGWESEPQQEDEPPADPRWSSLHALLVRIRKLAGDADHLADVARQLEVRLRDLLADQAALLTAVDAERALGEGEAHDRRLGQLEEAASARAQAADQLVEAVRDLHVQLTVRDASMDPVVEQLQALLAQTEAETELASAQAARGARMDAAARAQRANAQRSDPNRE